MEPYAHCARNTPFVVQAKELGWKIFQDGPRGTPGENNWKCVYKIKVNVPTGLTKGVMGADDANFSIPGLYTARVPIDWAQMCKDQYGDTASVWWVGGSSGSPWQCMGAPGWHYDQYDINRVPDRLQGVANYVLN
jgi:hypothetical protein